MALSPCSGLLVEALDIGLELGAVDPPHSSAADLDRGKLPGADERVHLSHADVQIGRDVVEREETRLDRGDASGLSARIHDTTIPAEPSGNPGLRSLTFVCSSSLRLAAIDPLEEAGWTYPTLAS
jgi:hypothetical protein